MISTKTTSKINKTIIKPFFQNLLKKQQHKNYNIQINNNVQQINHNNNMFLKSYQINNNKLNKINKQILIRKATYSFSTSQQSIIQTLQQVKKGNQFLQKCQYNLSINQYEMALKFLPKKIDNNLNYQTEYQMFLQKLLQANILMGKKVQKYLEIYKDYINLQSNFGKFLICLTQLEHPQKISNLKNLQIQDKLWKSLVRTFAFKNGAQCYGKYLNMEQISKTNDMSLKYIGLYLYEKIKNRQNKQRQNIYLNSCRQLLKQAQKFRPIDVIKPLSLTACNLYAGDQFLQSEGLLSHCISTLEQFYHSNPHQLKVDQKYIHFKLLMSKIYEKVKRQMQHGRIQQQYGNLWNQNTFLIQELVQINYKSI